MTRSDTAQALIAVSLSHEALLVACTSAYVALVRLNPVVRAQVSHELEQVRDALALARQG